MWRDRVKDWGSTFAVAVGLVVVTLITVIFAAPHAPNAIQNALYTGAFTLFFVGLMGGMLKILLDDVATVKRKREDAAAFVTNVLADLKAVYDRVARARLLIPAHKSVKTYGDEMRNLIEARVQLRNVTRALEGRAEGMIDDTREKIARPVKQMEAYLETLTSEFRDNYKPLSDQQRGYEEQAKVMLKCFAASDGDVMPPLPGSVWKSITRLERLSDFIGEANQYKAHFEAPLDDASKSLRNELARIIGRKSPPRHSMTTPRITPSQVRRALLLRDEIALLDVRHEAAFATGHPLFAANMAADRIELEAGTRLPRKDVPIVVYDGGEGLVPLATDRLMALGYTNVRQLDGGLQGWQAAGYELFRDVNSYAKAFGELVESRRHTPSLPADDVAALIASEANIAILDVRRFDEYATMNIPGSVSVPGAELVLRAGSAAPDPETTIIVNCAGRTRSIIGTQSLINAGVANKVLALRNGTIGWTLANQHLEHGADRRGGIGLFEGARTNARDVAYRAGVRHLSLEEAVALEAQTHRTLYRFDVRSADDYAAGHIPGFRHYPGGQLVQEIDMAAPVRGARILLTDEMGVRADMTASWLAQMGWETYVLDGGYERALEAGPPHVLPRPDPSQRYRRPYEGTDVDTSAMQAYLDWEYGLVEQLRRDATHGFFVI